MVVTPPLTLGGTKETARETGPDTIVDEKNCGLFASDEGGFRTINHQEFLLILPDRTSVRTVIKENIILFL